ncbi:thiolase family protein [Amycolatopsis acididurans]|uniref:thiolase family protein n=1 Tax=Amycolatopsis acididurans TaxID=2724524 RepID=UPI001B336A45|nr:thiolase family protein [Amycolatopsis acididurans]
MVVAGVGMHPFGRFEGVTPAQMGQLAVTRALADAGMRWADVDAAYFASMYLPATSGARTLKPLGATGIPISDVEAACASGGVALKQAILGLRAGEYDCVAVVGVEKMPRGFMDPAMIFEPWQIELGLSVNPSYWAMRASRHMHEYGTTETQIAKVAVKNHRNSVHNENAMYRKEFSLDEILASPLVCDPIRLLEICAPNEGAAAVILTRGDRPAPDPRPEITIAGCAQVLAGFSADWRAPMHSLSARADDAVPPTSKAAEKAYAEAGIGPDDIDCFEVQDTDAFSELEAYEHLGLCRPGEGGRLIDEGVTDIGGPKPVNASGGLISKGEPVGASHLGQVVEIVRQLRGEARPRQVSGAATGLAHVLGAAGNCAVTILRRSA